MLCVVYNETNTLDWTVKTLYLECKMGAAGDMLLAALLELHSDRDGFLMRLNRAGIPKVAIGAATSFKAGIKGTRVEVAIEGMKEGAGHRHGHSHGAGHGHGHKHDHNHEHEHNHEHRHGHEHGHAHAHKEGRSSYYHIEELRGGLDIPMPVKKSSIEVYRLLADAESAAHGKPIRQIHFHEVGEMDAVADIVGVCMLMDELSPSIVYASPINVGSGFVKCAHGTLPVPAPATAHLLRGVPTYSSGPESELCTPTGAALLRHFVRSHGSMPQMSVEKMGYGMGKKDFEEMNCVRAFYGELVQTESEGAVERDVIELSCNLDDMTPEAIAFAQQLLHDNGALDVYAAPIVMKKGRMGVSFTCLCRASDKEKMAALIFKHTSTLGIKEYQYRRYTLDRKSVLVETELGGVNVKTASGYGAAKSKPEFEDIAKIARDKDISLNQAAELIKAE
ncbi:MAG: nickel pincer cofactor biosynthesis protein LarC [Holophagales bacterium]|jgi:uncharacterized protein (TIGR00299 family) protein|nr:nickel pincer cofactor biosynthesis protein LarC [Holophagales bacterium]